MPLFHGRQTKCAVVMASVLLSLTGIATASASGTTPDTYRATVNGLCRGYQPQLKRLDAQITKAQQSKNWQAAGYSLAARMVLVVKEDTRIEHIPVPAAIGNQTGAALKAMKARDNFLGIAFTEGAAGNAAGYAAALRKADQAQVPMVKQFDRIGLRDCGSNQ